ncbi:SH3 domain-containing protein [Anaerococcus sp. AGMB00486]|uniref:SH3 domain-containing protein n=2 Tax=Anaerococcus TaxID=165779 RepID=A0ABX2N9V2_9FIRM|nr:MULTISPECIES: SH3 domain-containing protein [Anaerococcus]MDY3005922.1 SH3 domain-containing protein [Anaerococcus porci]MSS77638.1 SH3 domain-containing protein [Anaerococcus porci]NVF11492.1 SH3 domain-containing protein [Anaerococcus faecalis]
MKKKILFILSLGLILSACQKEDYKSQRHPEENNKSQVEANVQYSKKDKSNDTSNAKLKKENPSEEKKDEKNASNTDNKENKKIENEEEKTKNQDEKTENKDENIEGSFTVDNITNIRRNTTTDSEIVAKLQPGNIVNRTEIDGEWSKVIFESYEGYILTELLVPAN